MIDYRDADRQIWEEELADFVPNRVFDAHCHLFQTSCMLPGAELSKDDIEDIFWRNAHQALAIDRD